MPDISIQFYALSTELIPLVEDVVREFDLSVTTIRFRPFGAVAVEHNAIETLFKELSPRQRVAFTLGAANLPVENELDFAKKNPDYLRLDVGQQGHDGLEQSWLSARTENAVAISTWRKIAKRIETITEKGVTAINRDTGAIGVMRSFRYTTGAKDLEDHGVHMLPTVGPHGPRIRLGVHTQTGES